MGVSKSASLDWPVLTIIQVVNARDAERNARDAYADALARGWPYPEARRAYLIALQQHAAADARRLNPVGMGRTLFGETGALSHGRNDD
jgi:hypothetical protein